ncbi:MAG: type I methionyl aminopeptidase [candidate division KSB1 bacterium]|nr:type I methionyl aminopeptidase [candidate division KSB1 bacterium]
MIVIKTPEQIERMRRSCQLLVEAFREAEKLIVPGVRTREIDAAVEAFVRARGGLPAFKGYRGYPASVCISVNEVVIHGIPGDQELREGDIVSLDMGVVLDGYYSDGARTYAVGQVSEEKQRLMDAAREALEEAIAAAREGNRVGDISWAIQRTVEARGFSVVRQFCGHGIGRNLHEEPEVPNYGSPRKGPRLRCGMTLALETMVNAGTHEVEILADGWTVVTRDRKPSAHFEHTVAITDRGADVLTLGL